MKISFQWLTGNDNQSKGLWPIEWLAITYSILTTLTMFVLWPDMNHPWDMFADRLYIFLGTILLWRIYLLWPRRLSDFLSVSRHRWLCSATGIRTLTSSTGRSPIWTTYSPDGMPCCSVASPHWNSAAFAHGLGFPEAVNMGYFSYYPMIVAVMVFSFSVAMTATRKPHSPSCAPFFIFYLVYIFLPVAGPQFYFQAVSPGKCRERDISVFRHLLQPSYRYATLAGLCRRFLLSFSRMGSGFRRTPDSRFSFLAYRYYFLSCFI